MGNPANLKYTKDHEWVRVEGNTAIVGITQFAQSELGDVVYIDLPRLGKQLKQRDQLCVVESTKAASEVFSPISGTVKEVNTALSTQPDLINSSPYEQGWIAKLSDVVESDLNGLLSVEDYDKLTAK